MSMILVCGVAGSGKTTYVNNFENLEDYEKLYHDKWVEHFYKEKQTQDFLKTL